ncbi:hypothetical protein WJX82_000371 [Trebouxia sp. C0006]
MDSRQPACRQARHIAHTPLHLSHANQRSNNKHNGEDHPPAAALMALCMASLESLTESLKGVSIRLTKQEWTQISPAVLAVCSVQAGTSWLGYCPGELLHQARQVVSHLTRVSDSSTSYSSQMGADTNIPSSSMGHAQTQLAHPKGRHWSATQPLRSTAHQMIAGKNKPVNSLPSQTSAKRQRELTALQLTLQSAPAVLQDMASHAAEAVAVCYLAEARSGLNEGGLEGEDSWPLHLHPHLRSTRGLERFRNQVSLNRLVHQNLHSVANIYEDKHQLCGFGAQAQLLQRSVNARRVKELESLKGWKYIVSLLLEAGDIALPIFRNCMARVSAAISWLLVKLIGRALGLIYRGVKQSLVPQRQKHRKGQTVSTDTEGPQAWMPKFS